MQLTEEITATAHQTVIRTSEIPYGGQGYRPVRNSNIYNVFRG